MMMSDGGGGVGVGDPQHPIRYPATLSPPLHAGERFAWDGTDGSLSWRASLIMLRIFRLSYLLGGAAAAALWRGLHAAYARGAHQWRGVAKRRARARRSYRICRGVYNGVAATCAPSSCLRSRLSCARCWRARWRGIAPGCIGMGA